MNVFTVMGFLKKKVICRIALKKILCQIFFFSTTFKKHHRFLLDENKKSLASKMFHLPATLDRKEEFLRYKDNVHLHPIDVNYEELRMLNEGNDMNPNLLENKALRKDVVMAYYKVMKNIAEFSNQNLIKNSDTYLVMGGKIDPENEFQWIDDSYKKEQQKFQLTY